MLMAEAHPSTQLVSTTNSIYPRHNKHADIFSAQGAGQGDWADAYARARQLVAQMTNEEKQNVTIGYASMTNGCSGNSGNVSRLGFPGLCLNDAGNGLRSSDGSNGYPSGIHVGASWNRFVVFESGKSYTR